VALHTATAGATIFYNLDSAPTHTGNTPTGTTKIYSTTITVNKCFDADIFAIAYKAGMTDSDVTEDFATNYGSACTNNFASVQPLATAQTQMQTIVTTTIFSVRDGDWALLEEYGNDINHSLVESYVEGYHGLVKTLVSNIYYYQDELGSTSHIADANGVLLENYRYDLYGKPKFSDANNTALTISNYGVKDLYTGQRWVAEIGMYDDRNRFMSPDLGRFIQADPIGFKGDASNLYRYCGND
jgi:RHS repeat-associated protein